MGDRGIDLHLIFQIFISFSILRLTLVCYLDANEVKRALIMSDVPLGDSSTDEMMREEEEEHASELTSKSANQSPPSANNQQLHANEQLSAAAASANEIAPRSGHPDDSGISTSESPDKEQYDNEHAKSTSMNRLSRSSMQGELKKRQSTKDRPAPQPPGYAPPPSYVKQESCDKPIPAERKINAAKKKDTTAAGAVVERKTSVKDREEVSRERARKTSFKESLERKLSAKSPTDDLPKGTTPLQSTGCYGNQAVLPWRLNVITTNSFWLPGTAVR